MGAKRPTLIAFEVQGCDRFPGAPLLWVGGGGFGASGAPKKGRKRGAFTRARIKYD